MVRVLFDHQAFSIQPRGGITRYVLELAAALSRGGGVRPLVHAGWHRSEALRARSVPWASGRFVPAVPKTLPLRQLLNTVATRRAVRRWRPDLVHETYFRCGDAYDPRIPTVLTMHDLIYFGVAARDAAAPRVRRAQIESARRAAAILCVSETTRSDLLRYIPVDAQRVHVVPLAATPAPDRSDPPPPDGMGPYLLHVGLRNSYKNFGTLLEAFAASPLLRGGYRLVAFGGGDFTAEEKARVHALGLGSSVLNATGDDALLSRFYRHATALVCPSRYEGFGLPALEAMTHGCPVIASRSGSLPEVTGDAALLFDPTSATELARTLERVAGSNELREELQRRGRARAVAFSWERCAAATLAVYRAVLA